MCRKVKKDYYVILYLKVNLKRREGLDVRFEIIKCLGDVVCIFLKVCM